ncbi:hypothetical protein [Pyrobaculum sp.]|uniref:hypothetical protein n=1 Tax=Pyrobaculum sp. TaxID=2004705 RepID=UPI00317A1932
MYVNRLNCPVCGVEFDTGRKEFNGVVTCPNGHTFTVIDSNTVIDCEIRDWDRFAKLPPSMQNAVIEIIQSGKIPEDMKTLMRRLREAGIVVCT